LRGKLSAKEIQRDAVSKQIRPGELQSLLFPGITYLKYLLMSFIFIFLSNCGGFFIGFGNIKTVEIWFCHLPMKNAFHNRLGVKF